MLEAMISAGSRLGEIEVILILFLGVLIGMVIGVLPGLSGVVALGIVIPFTFGWEPIVAMYLFIGIMGSSMFSGSVTAILLNTPGTPPNAATCFDGHPMARQGHAGKALGISATASGLGAIVGVIVLAGLIPIMRMVVLAFGPAEMFWIILFGLVAVSFAARGNMIKGLIAGGLGILISLIGYSYVHSNVPRFTGGSYYLWDGVQLVPFMVGLLAVSEVINYTVRGGTIAQGEMKGKLTGVLDGVKEVFRHKIAFFRSAAIGTGIGIVPGVGGVTASFLSYTTAMQTSKHPETFGTGNPEGVLAPEASNNAKDAGALIPALSFGIPGDPSTAMLLAAFVLHGLEPGPMLLVHHLDIAWALIFGLVIANVITSTLGLIVAPYLAKLSNIRVRYIAPVVLVLCFSGVFVIRGNIWDVVLTLIAGIFGYGLNRFGFPVICLVIGYILGVIAEISYFQAIRSNWGSYSIFFTSPISQTLIILLVIILLIPVITKIRQGMRSKG
ncbi:tripartite tricarboxylate transporter permease [Chloroflexota bacterium]